MRYLLAIAALALAGPALDRPVVDADPPLWVARDGDTTVYLFGSVHWLKQGTGWFDEAVKTAFDASDTLVLESVAPPRAEAEAEMNELGTIADGPSLPERLPSDARPRLAAALRSVGYAPDAFDHVEPWLAATSLSVLPLQKAGYSASYGVEAVLTAAARDAGKPIVALESTRTQLGYFDTMPQADQVAMLLRVLGSIDAVVDSNDRTVAAWARGDVAGLRAIVADDLRQSSQSFADAIVDRRNARWADWLAGRMATPGTVFVAVGSAHLVGPGDLLTRLRERGVEVRRIDY
nr:TraB/GumN family protein [Sphingomonas japonica]